MSQPRPAHSENEAVLFVTATPCASCGRGPLESRGVSRNPCDGGTALLAITTHCRVCNASGFVEFSVPTEMLQDSSDGASDEGTNLNPTEEPSHILDVGQWIMLFRLFEQQAAGAPSKVEARVLNLKAGACLNEALKFYEEDDNDLPPGSAMFTDSTRRRFREAPEQFSRRRLIGLRATLPVGRRKRPGDFKSS